MKHVLIDFLRLIYYIILHFRWSFVRLCRKIDNFVDNLIDKL